MCCRQKKTYIPKSVDQECFLLAIEKDVRARPETALLGGSRDSASKVICYYKELEVQLPFYLTLATKSLDPFKPSPLENPYKPVKEPQFLNAINL